MAIKRSLILALILILAVMPAGFAAEGYDSLTLSNFHFELGESKPSDVDASVKVGYGGALPDGPARLDVDVTGDGKTAFSGSAYLKDGEVHAVLRKSKYRFVLPLDQMEGALFSDLRYPLQYGLMYGYWYGFADYFSYMNYGGSSSGKSTKESFQKIGGLFERYLALIEKYRDEENVEAFERKVYAGLGATAGGVEETELFGEKMRLNRFDIVLEGRDLRKYYDAIYAAEPELKALEDDADALMEELDDSYYGYDSDKDDEEPEDEDAPDPLDEAIEASGIDKVSCALWTDAKTLGDAGARAFKAVVTVSVGDDVDAYGMPIQYEFPVRIECLEDQSGTRLSFKASIAPYEGESLVMDFTGALDAVTADGGLESTGKLTVDFNSKADGEATSFAVTLREARSADGVRDFSAGVGGESNGQAFDLGFDYDGRSAAGARTEGAVTISYDFPSTAASQSAPSKGLIRFDALTETAPLQPVDESEYQDLQPVNPLRAKPSAMDKVSSDLYGAVMQGVGALMQTKGLSGIIGGLMSAA